MAVRLRAAWAAAGALWAAQLAEGVLAPGLLNAELGLLLDSLTIVVTVTLVGWHLLDRCGLRPAVTRAEYEANRDDIEMFKRNFSRARQGIKEATGPAGQPLRCVRDDEAAG
jgi:hypothetical protein